MLQVLAGLGFTELTTLPDGTVLETTNLTLLNVLLLRLGPMREKRLTQALIVVQVIHCYLRRVVWTSSLTIYCQVMGSIVAFVVRYGLAYLVYDGDRR
jgi:UDP-N-acetylglucosamine--dolichyl-phosphate N-acetylglucosaminephosphotransferase